MRRKTVVMLLAIICFTAVAASAQKGLELYERALVQELAAGNLTEAIALYRQAANEAGNDRVLAARALIRAAGSYEKLGQPEAAELYTQVMRTYPEQRDQVALAQSKLASLKTPARATPTKAAQPGRTDVSAVFDPLFENYCVSCHNQNRKTAGLALDSLNTNNVGENTATWERIVRRLHARRDSPMGMRRPDEAIYQSAISTAELALDQAYPVNSSLNAADRVSDAELAARMAKFIWNGSPDNILQDVVQRGRLREPAVLEQQVRRMLRDSKANGLVTQFLERWVLWDGLDKAKNMDDALRQDFATETRMFLENQVREDHSALDLWTANYSFLNDRLARHYGIAGVNGSNFQQVTYPDNRRAGILGQGSFLSVSSANDRTSPVTRGKMILQMFLGVSPADPPPNVPAVRKDDARPLPMRARMEEHRTNPACASCHVSFEPLGLALENFNLNGQWRATDAGVTIDASGTLVDGTKFNGPAELRATLLKYRDAYYSNITQKLLGYALGRDGRAWRIYDYEMPSVRAIVRESAANDYRWSAIVLGIVKSTPFQMKTIVP
jgi:mono/diheme cytochrome c family protein